MEKVIPKVKLVAEEKNETFKASSHYLIYKMLSPQSQKIRTYLFNIINNNFEPFIREYIQNHILSSFESIDEWKENVPEYTLAQASTKLKTTNYDLDEYMTTLYLFDLKNIMIYKNNFEHCKNLIGQNLTEIQFGEIMDLLNITRTNVDHPFEIGRDTLDATISRIRLICNNTITGKEMLEYLNQHSYEHGVAPPPICIHNLRKSSYESDGGFISRPEIKNIIDKINKKLNRIIDIIGSGGVGKTAIAEYICHHYISDQRNPFYAILFYSAKEEMLTERGIIDIKSNLSDYETFIVDLHTTLIQTRNEQKKTTELMEKEIYDFVDESKGNHRCLIIIDNLENPNIFKNKRLRKFIEEFPRDSQIIITSRIGTDMPEERLKITAMNDKQAIELVKRYSRTRFFNRTNLYELTDKELISLVNRVYCVPLLIKIAVGRHIELGQNLNLAFSVGGKKDKEAINFMLSETYAMLSPQAKLFLECMAAHKNIKISRAALIEMTMVYDISEFETMVQQVESVSLVKREIIDKEEIFIIDQIANKYLQDLLYNNELEKKKIGKRYIELLSKVEKARQYLVWTKIEGINSELKESEYLAASHIADAINFNLKRNLNPILAYDQAAKEFTIAKELAPWWYHTDMEYAFFEANWNHPGPAGKLLNEAKQKNSKCEEYAKYQEVMKIINPAYMIKTNLPLKPEQILDVKIEKKGVKGDGIAYHEGCIIFVKNGEIGKSVRIKIIWINEKSAFAEIITQ